MCPGVRTQAPILITSEETHVNNMGGQSTDLLLDTETNYSMFTEAPGPHSPQ